MKKTNLIILAIIVIILILIGVFFFAKKGQAPQNGSQNNQVSEEKAAQPSVKESLLGLLEGMTGVKCSVSDNNVNYTVIAKGGKARIEGMNFANPSDPQQAQKPGTMINDGTWAYIWSGKEGKKFNIKEMEAANAAQGGAATEDSDWQSWAKSMQESGAKYDCQPGLATDADFTPPADVKFQDLGEMLKAFQQMQTNPGAAIPGQ